MSGRFYLDGRDAYREYGVFVAEDGFGSLLTLPPLKAAAANDWPEEDGTEVDLSEPRLDSQQITLRFSAHGRLRVGLFIELISTGAYHAFEFRSLGRSYTLRLVSQPALERMEGMEAFSLRFANDFPLREDYRYEPPRCGLSAQTGYELDGRPLADYGISLLAGSLDELTKSPAVKQNLLQNLANRHGAAYDPATVLFQPKEVRLRCLMRARDMAEFWRNYDALLYDLSRPELRTLYAEQTGYEYPCCYKSCSVHRFEPAGRIWFEFDLNLTFTSFRVLRDEYVLASERGALLLGEDESAIDLVE